RAADLAGIEPKLSDEFFGGGLLVSFGIGDQQYMIDERTEEANARIAAIHCRHDDHVIAAGLVESALDIGIVDAAVAAALRRNESDEIDIGFAIDPDGVGEQTAADRDVDQSGFAGVGVDRR